MALPEMKKYTVEDIYALPAGERAELIDGRIYSMSPPSRTHQRIVGRLYTMIVNYIDKKGGGCEAYVAPFAVYLDENLETYVEPDISVICDMEKLDENGCKGAPDWIIEVVSPGSSRMDYVIKLFKYRSAGVREYWLVDPQKDRITVWDLEKENTREYSFSEPVRAGIYEELVIDLSGYLPHRS